MPEVVRRGYFRVDLADNCNIRCIMCQAYNSMPVSAMKFLDFDTFVGNTRGEIGKWDYVQLGNVAEATIHPRFPDFLRYIRAEAPETCIHIVTNAKTLHKFAALINEAGNCIVHISMDSVRKETHEYIRDGSIFHRALENMSMLDTSRNRVLLSFTLMRSNVSQYAEMVEFCRKRGYSMSCFPMILRSENGVIPYYLLQESLWFNLDLLRIWLKQYYGVQYEKMVGTASGASPLVADFDCNAHYQDLNMDSAGTVNLCGKLTLGNLGRSRLQDLWHSAEAGAFRMQVETDRGPCMTCDYRQRCLSPSMSVLDNHFSEELVAAISPETREKIRYDRTISDDEARWHFMRDIGGGIFEIAGGGKEWVARKVIPLDTPCAYRSGEPMTASSRHELHDMMRREADSGLYVDFLESYGRYNLVKYHGQYWALPVSLGHLNITHEPDRLKPGIITAATLAELKALCGEDGVYVPPRLLESLNGHNLVAYEGKYWAIPLAFGPYDLTQPKNQNREGIRVSHTLEHLRRMCDVFPILTA
jgi:radical SAM protein with 4Fe4S-binding SPASM domain